MSVGNTRWRTTLWLPNSSSTTPITTSAATRGVGVKAMSSGDAARPRYRPASSNRSQACTWSSSVTATHSHESGSTAMVPMTGLCRGSIPDERPAAAATLSRSRPCNSWGARPSSTVRTVSPDNATLCIRNVSLRPSHTPPSGPTAQCNSGDIGTGLLAIPNSYSLEYNRTSITGSKRLSDKSNPPCSLVACRNKWSKPESGSLR